MKLWNKIIERRVDNLGILSLLVETEETIKMKERMDESLEDEGRRRYRIFKHIPLKNGVSLSIQASSHHHCEPKLTLDVGKYDSMELLIIKDGCETNIESVTDDEELIEELNEYTFGEYDGEGAWSVYGRVPIDLLNRIYNTLK